MPGLHPATTPAPARATTPKPLKPEAEVERLRRAGVKLRNEIVSGPGGAQVLLTDPSGNLVELFQPAVHR